MHFPIIRTIPIEKLDKTAKQAWDKSTHMLFTSRSAVKHWLALSSLKGEILAIGEATAATLKGWEGVLKIAPTATQEGVVDLLKTLDLSSAYLFWPRSALSRPIIDRYLMQQGIPFYPLNLYTTKPQASLPLPNLDEFDEIVFTSPSTVEAFLAFFGCLPTDKRLTPIGPVTHAALFP